MTFDDVIAAGGGAFELRIEIEGWPVQYCTDGITAGALADGRQRVHGLIREGISFDETARMQEGDSDRSGFTATIVDLNEESTALFTKEPRYYSWLTGDELAADIVLKVANTSGFTAGDVVHCGSEAMLVTVVWTSTVLVVTRGYWGSTARRQTATAGAGLQYPEITTDPLTLSGRRVYVYAHGSDELGLLNTGRLLYRGVARAEPRLRGVCEWSLEVDSLLSLLDQEISAKLDDIQIRGIYYPASSALEVRLTQGNTHTYSGAVVSGTTALVQLTGFFESQAAFAAHVDTQIAAAMAAAGHSGSIACRYTAENWWFEFTPGSPAHYTIIDARSVVDGKTDYRLINLEGIPTDEVAHGDSYRAAWIEGSVRQNLIDFGFGNADTLSDQIKGRTVPRAAYGRGWRAFDTTLAATHPDNVIYLASSYELNAGDDITITPRKRDREAELGGTPTAPPYQAVINAITAATGAVELRDFAGGVARPIVGHALLAGWGGRIDAATCIGSTAGDLSDFRTNLIAKSADALPGTLPLVLASDWEDITDTVREAAGGRHYVRNRLYRFSKPVKLRELIQHECLMLGCFLTTKPDGTLTVKPIRAPVPTDLLAYVLGTADRVVSNGFGTVELSPDGFVNRVNIETGYNPASGKNEGPIFAVRDVRSISRMRRELTEEIKPKGRAQTQITSEDQPEDIPMSMFGIYADRYTIAEVDCSWRLFNTGIGDSVNLEAAQLPFQGARGINATGLVVGRKWSVTDAHGTLSILFAAQGYAGYTPAARVLGATGAGVAWQLTTEANRYAPFGVLDAQFFLVGHAVQIVEWNTGTPTIVTGTVTAVASNVIDVTFAAAWAGVGASVWNLVFDDYSLATADQRQYCYDADASAVLAGTTPARSFAP